MGLYINTNVAAQGTSTTLRGLSEHLAKGQGRLAAGVKNVSDDASSASVGFAISATLGSLTQAASNAAQGSALLQLGMAALSSTEAVFQRMNQLAAQANSSSIDDTRRGMIDQEFQKLLTQVDTNSQTKWFSTQLFAGGGGTAAGGGGTGSRTTAETSLTIGTGSTRVNSLRDMIGGVTGAATVPVVGTSNIIQVVVGGETFNSADMSLGGIAAGGILTLTSTSSTNALRFTVGSAGIAATTQGASNASNDIALILLTVGLVPGGATGYTLTNAATSLVPVTNAFSGGLNFSSTQGFYSGVASNATVTANGSLYNVSVNIGAQTFKGTVNAPTASGELILTSVTDSANVVSFDYAAAVSAITSAATFQSTLQSMLGITTGTNAIFTSRSATIDTNLTSITSGSATTAGDYGLTYTYDSTTGGTFKLTNGAQSYTSTVAASLISGGVFTSAQTVSFGNGLNFIAGTSFVANANKPMEIINVGTGTGVTFTFQTGQTSADTTSVSFSGAGVSALGLSGLSVGTTTNAQAATTAILTAMTTVANQIATLGGVNSQLGYLGDNLAASIQNQSAARATFTDVDVADELTNVQRLNANIQVAQTMFTQSMKSFSSKAELVQSAAR